MMRAFDESGFRALALVAALIVVASPVFAETLFSFYLGTSHMSNSDVHIRQPGTGSDAVFHNVAWNTDSFSPPLYYGIRISHFFEQAAGWGAGLEFTHDKAYSNPAQLVQVTGTWNGARVNETARMSQRVQLFNISHGVNTLALNLFHRWPLLPALIPGIGWQPYIGAAPTHYLLHAENIVNGQPNTEVTKGGGTGYQVLAGVQFRLTPLIRAFVEAKYNSGKVEVDIAGGRADTTLSSTQLLAGLSVGL